jgi:DNA phosphorothioation-associated putative methyltransferase
MELAANTRQVLSLGKKVIEDLYIHLDYLKEVREAPDFGPLIDAGMDLMIKEDLDNCNVLKINLHKQKLSFLQYLNFEIDPFPTLNGSWTVDSQKATVSFRSYSSSLNPPILHRKELLVHVDHPGRYTWVAVTKMAEELGLFATSSPIGFRQNWERVIAGKGFRLENLLHVAKHH